MKLVRFGFAVMAFLMLSSVARAFDWQGVKEGFSVEYSSMDSIRLRWAGADVSPAYLRTLERASPVVQETNAACWIAIPRDKRPQISRIENFPATGTVYLGDPLTLRDAWIAPINLQLQSPTRAEGNVSTGTITIAFVTGTPVPGVRTRGVSGVYFPLYQTLTPNFLDVNPNATSFLPPTVILLGPVSLLPAVNNPMQSWINMRRSQGWTVVVQNFAGGVANNPTSIRSYLQNAYDTWANPPDALYIIGDETQVATTMTWTDDPNTIFSSGSGGTPYPGSYIDDHNYGRMDGPLWRTFPDPFTDILVGRMLAVTTTDVLNQANKTVNYEANPDTTIRYNHSMVAADQQAASQRLTKLWTADRMREAGINLVDTLFTSSSGSLINSSVNAGRAAINYRGQGWGFGWAGIGYYYTHVQSLSNTNKPIIVTGIGCGVAKFDETSCFGESWMKIGTPTNALGAAGFIGPTWNTHTQYNNQLDMGLYRMWVTNQASMMGIGLLGGKAQVYASLAAYYPTDTNISEILRVAAAQYICLSDPIMQPHLGRPKILNVQHPVNVQTGQRNLAITVTDTRFGIEMKNLRVVVSDTNQFLGMGYTDRSGMVTIPIDVPSRARNIRISLGGFQAKPVIDTIPVTAGAAPSIDFSEFSVVDTTGIRDQMMSPGEEGYLSVKLRNIGNGIGRMVTVSVSSNSPRLMLRDSVITIDSIATGDSITVQNTGVLLSQSYRAGELLSVTMLARMGADTVGLRQFTVSTAMPNLRIDSLLVDAARNGRIDREETALVDLVLRNTGELALPQTHVEWLAPVDSLIHVDTDTSSMNAAATGVATHLNSPFVLTSTEWLPAFHVYRPRVAVRAVFPTWVYSDTLNLPALITGTMDTSAPSHRDSLPYFAYEWQDSTYSEAPQTPWMDIAPRNGGSGTRLNLSGSVLLTDLNLPIQFRYFGEVSPTITVSNKGWVSAVPSRDTLVDNSLTPLPIQDHVRGMIAVWWDNIWRSSGGEGVYWMHDTTNHRVLIQWDSISRSAVNPNRLTFALALYDSRFDTTPTGDSKIEMLYKDMRGAVLTSGCIGIENPAETGAITMVNNSYVDSLAHAPAGLRGIRFTTSLPRIRPNTRSDETEPTTQIPVKFDIHGPYPNPFNNETSLSIGLPVRTNVSIRLYDRLGREVKTMYHSVAGPGYIPVRIDASGLSSGVYFVRISTEFSTNSRKIVLLR